MTILTLALSWLRASVWGAGSIQAAALYPPPAPPFYSVVEEGRARAAILLPERATAAEQEAAKTLQAYFKRITGAELPLLTEPDSFAGFVIAVGRTALARQRGALANAERLAPEGFLIRCRDNAALLVGRDELGTLYAAFTLLEQQCGVRWFAPGDLGTVVPSAKTLRLGTFETVEEPDFRLRWVGRGAWARANKMNVNVGEWGLKIFGSAHTFRRLVPPEKYYQDHPEYFALVQGQRTQFAGVHRNQLCTSNPEVIATVIANIRTLREREPDWDVVSLFPNDGLGFCECAACRSQDEGGPVDVEDINSRWNELSVTEKSGVLSRRMTLFYRAVAEGLLALHPDLLLKTGIYSAYLAPPQDTTLRGLPNMMGQVCHGMCHNHPLTDPNCEINRAFRAMLERWREIYPQLCLYEYYWKVAALELPFPIVHSIRQDLPYFHRLGVTGLYTQYAENWGTIGLNYYVAAKLLWNVETDVDALLADFYEKFYAQAAGPMRAYHEALERAAQASGSHLAAEYPELLRLFTDELLTTLDGHLKEAERVAVGDLVRKRVALSRLSWKYVRLCVDYLKSLQDAAARTTAHWEGEEVVALEEPTRRAQAIRDFLEAHADSVCFRVRNNNYLARFLNVPYAFGRFLARAGERGPALTKRQWLAAEPGRRPPPPSETFDLWIYGYDWDRDAEKPEHEVFARNRAGERVRLGELAPPGESGNRCARAFVFPGLRRADFPPDRLIVEILNRPGDWVESTLYAVYVMPPGQATTPDQATEALQKRLEEVRAAAIGFVEYGYRGQRNREGETLVVEVEW